MHWFDQAVNFIFNGFFYFFIFLVVLFALAILFGDRVKKTWDFEAEFFDEGDEVGEFDLELSQILKKEKAPSLKGKLSIKSPKLKKGQSIEVLLNDQLVMRGEVGFKNKAWLRTEALVIQEIQRPKLGDICQVLVEGKPIFKGRLKPD